MNNKRRSRFFKNGLDDSSSGSDEDVVMIDTTTTKPIQQPFYDEYPSFNAAADGEQHHDPNLIPPEILERYFGPQNLFQLSMTKTDFNLQIEFNRILKDVYFQLFHGQDDGDD